MNKYRLPTKPKLLEHDKYDTLNPSLDDFATPEVFGLEYQKLYEEKTGKPGQFL